MRIGQPQLGFVSVSQSELDRCLVRFALKIVALADEEIMDPGHRSTYVGSFDLIDEFLADGRIRSGVADTDDVHEFAGRAG